MTDNRFIVDVDWLFSRLGDPSVSVVDGSWYLPAMKRDAKAEFETAHIPSAVFFDIDEVVDPDSSLPHTLAGAKVFAEKVGKLGISDADTIVVYDGMGFFSAARVWWNFRLMGAKEVLLLDGGFPSWQKRGFPVEDGWPSVSPKTFNAHCDSSKIVSFDEMRAVVSQRSQQIADARPLGRFTGEEPEPRAGMRSGHMPGAVPVPFSNLAENGSLRSSEDLKRIFESAGVDLSQPVVTTCGSGVTAAALILALESIGHRDNRLYDGSWSEWGGRSDTEIETGR